MCIKLIKFLFRVRHKKTKKRTSQKATFLLSDGLFGVESKEDGDPSGQPKSSTRTTDSWTVSNAVRKENDENNGFCSTLNHQFTVLRPDRPKLGMEETLS